MSGYAFLDIILACVAVYLISLVITKLKGLPLPPGPKPKPIVGNLTDLPPPGESDWLHWTKHKDLYGPISSVSVFRRTIIIKNDLQVAFELLDQQSSVFSDRPILPFCGVMCGFDNTLAMKRYGGHFRALRRYLHQYMGSSLAMAKHQPLQELETRRFLLRLLDNSDRLQDQIRSLTGSIILKMSHGYSTKKDGEDPLVRLADDVSSEFSLSAQTGTWLVDFLPFLRYVPDGIPGTGYKRYAERCRSDLYKMVDLPLAFVKQQMASGSYIPSFTSAAFEEGVNSEEDEYLLKWAGMSIYSGGADTTVSALYSFFLAMTLYSDVKKRAQEEIDRVVGRDLLPSFGDRDNLPYINALLKETLRWNPALPLCVPHTSREDSMYNGYLIPKEAVVLPNIWWFTRDPSTYKDPEKFNPERFIGDKPEFDPKHIVFGFGRRICPGMELVDASLFINIAMILSVFDINSYKDSEGNTIEVKAEFMSGVISHPKDFACSITPRSESAKRLIQSVKDENPIERSDAEALARVKW